MPDKKPGGWLRPLTTEGFCKEVTGISYPLLTNTYHGGRGSVTNACDREGAVGPGHGKRAVPGILARGFQGIFLGTCQRAPAGTKP
jgi:hypothetical protein